MDLGVVDGFGEIAGADFAIWAGFAAGFVGMSGRFAFHSCLCPFPLNRSISFF